MNLADCYRLLGLKVGAKPEQIKASYRRLARTCHPDAHPHNPAIDRAQFVRLTEAYQSLLRAVREPVAGIPKPPPPRLPKLSPQERKLKSNSYQSLQTLLAQRRFARAIALVEGLAYRFPLDVEIRQWQAIAYQQQGRQAIRDRRFQKARIYLNKALRTDPCNRSLAAEIQRDFQSMYGKVRKNV